MGQFPPRAMISLFLSVSLLAAAGCAGISRKSARQPHAITPENRTNLQFTLPPLDFRVYALSNWGAPLADASPGWWKDAVVYQVYVRSFFDSDGDGHGDLPGLTSRLDYITNVGFNAIWTLPLFNSYNDGSVGRALGYEAMDYYAINPVYGTLKDFDDYAAAAHARGVSVILDMVINHGATNCEWFRKSERNDPNYAGWYIWTNAKLADLKGWGLPWGGGGPWDVWHESKARGQLYYATWGGEFNFMNTNVREEFFKIARYWLNRGADGYRLDAIRYLIETGPGSRQADAPPTFQYLEQYQAELKKTRPSAMTVGEVWADDPVVSRYYINGAGLDSCFSFDFQYMLKDAVANGSPTGLKALVRKRANVSNAVPLLFFSPFLDNHDMPRSIRSFGSPREQRAKLAAAVLLTFPGTPFVYFGNEIGLKGQYNPMRWDDTASGGFTTNRPWMFLADGGAEDNADYQLAHPDTLLKTYRRLISIRKNEPALRRGGLVPVKSDKPAILSYIRTGTNCSLLFIANFSAKETAFSLDLSDCPGGFTNAVPLYPLKTSD